MKKTLQDQYLLIKEGKGHKGVFLTEAKRQFPNIIRNSATFDEAVASLKTKHIISENIISVMPVAMDRPKKEAYETAFEAFLAEAKKKKDEDEKVKAEEKKVSKPVEEDLEKNFDYSDEKNPDNMIFGQIMMGYYAEMKDPKNSEKTMQELKDIVFKNLAKDPIYYTKNAQFGIKDLGYTDEVPALGTPKEAKGKYKSSGYGDLKESIQPKLKKEEAYKLFDYHERTGMFPKGMTKEEYNKIISYYNIKRNNDDTDPAGGSGLHSHLEEAKLRKVIREIIDEEIEEVRGGGNYGIPTIKISNQEKGNQKVPTYLILTPEARKEFNLLTPGPNASSYDESLKIPHIRITPNDIIYISNLLYITLEGIERGRGTREKQIEDNKNKLKVISNEISDRWWPSIRSLFKNFAETKTTPYPVFGKDVLYHQIRFKENGYKVEKLKDWIEKTIIKIDDQLKQAASGEVRRGRPVNVEALRRFKKQLEDMKPNAEGGMAIIPPKFGEVKEEELEEIMINGFLLKESVEKEIAEINKMAEYENLQSKLDKLEEAIEKRRSQLERLDEDEDMKALTDSKKVKSLHKDIKILESAKKKVEKMMSKFKGKKPEDKEVIDETENDPDVDQDYFDQSVLDLSQGKSVDSITSEDSNLALDQQEDLKDYLKSL
jgi:hypothetical protein